MWKTRVLPALVTAVLATAGVAATNGSATATPDGSAVVVHGSTQGLTVIHGPVHAGLVRFVVDTANAQDSDVVMFTPAPGKTADKVLADLPEELSHDPAVSAKGTRDLVADSRFYGLAAVVKGTPVIVSQQLKAGTYYLFDINPVFANPAQKPKLTTLQVSGSDDDLADRVVDDPSHATVRLTSDDRFVSPNVLPKAGTLTIRNTSDTIHLMDVSPVKPGTTDAQVQDFFDHGHSPQDQAPFALNGPSIEMEVQSPGRHADITYSLPAGTYVLECFVADDKTGMQHAIMGMHKVVTLK